eukprot:gene1848-4472_t
MDDLRHMNGNPGHTKFERFWDALGALLQNRALEAVDARRHGTLGHLSAFISTRTLIENICDSAEPEFADDDIPTERWVRLQFAHKDPWSHSAMHHTVRFNMRYRLQARNRHFSHIDMHWTNAVYTYNAATLAKLRRYWRFVPHDDKHYLHIGEPDMPVSCLGRNGKVFVEDQMEKHTAVLDHDNHALYCVPFARDEVPDRVLEKMLAKC